MFVSNLLTITKAELEAKFWRARRIVDIFIPVEKENRRRGGFTFVRFATRIEAERAVDMAVSRSRGGRRIQANITRFKSNGVGREEAASSRKFGHEGD